MKFFSILISYLLFTSCQTHKHVELANFACSPFLDHELELLRAESDWIPDSQLLMIGTIGSMRSIAAVIRNFHFRCRLFQLEGMNPLFDNTLFITESMFLIADKSGKVETLMAPPKNDDQSISMFFNYVNLSY